MNQPGYRTHAGNARSGGRSIDRFKNGDGPALETGDEQEQSKPRREEIFEVLSNERRRYVLGYLKQHESGSVDLGTLVTNVAALENDVPVEQLDSSDRKSVYVGLRQTHLPKMDEYNLVDYDSQRGKVELTEGAEQAQMYLEYVPEHDIPWAYHYVGLSALMGLIVGLVWIGMYPFGNLSGIAVAIITIGIVGLSAAVHTVSMYRNKLEHAYDFEG